MLLPDAASRAWVERPALELATGSVDFARSRFVRSDGTTVWLTTREAQLLAYLADRPNCPVSRDELLTQVWRHHDLSLSRAVDAAIRRVRQKIEAEPGAPQVLFTEHGHGYRLLTRTAAAPSSPPVETTPRRVLRLGARVAELAAGFVEVDGVRLALTAKERLILETLSQARGAAIDAQRLARAAGVIGGKHALNNAIYRLRGKLEDDPRAPRYLVSVPGIGYRLDAALEEPSLDRAQYLRALRSLTDHVGLVLGLDDCVVYLRSGDTLQQVAAYGVKRAEDGSVRQPLSQRLGQGLVGVAAAEDRPVCVADVDADRRYLEDLRRGRSELAVPVRAGGRVIGAIDSESMTRNAFGDTAITAFVSLAAIAAPAFERATGARDA